MTEKLVRRETDVPGPRTIVRLDVSEYSLPVLIEGVKVDRCWLAEEGDGLYSFHATQMMSEVRRQPGKASADILVELVNEFADALDAEDVPQRLRDQWGQMLDRYKQQTAKPTDPGVLNQGPSPDCNCRSLDECPGDTSAGFCPGPPPPIFDKQ